MKLRRTDVSRRCEAGFERAADGNPIHSGSLLRVLVQGHPACDSKSGVRRFSILNSEIVSMESNNEAER
jgi:hypothetical protein